MSAHAGHRPLVVFTSLAIAGSGIVAAAAYFEVVHGHVYRPAAAVGGMLLALGLAVSLGHLGKRRRAALAVRGAGRSALSNEVLMAGVALVSAMTAGALDLRGAHAPAITALAGIVNLGFLLSVGLVYRVRGQRTWQGFSALTPLTGGLAFGAIVIQSFSVSGGVFRGTLLLLAVDALVFVQRWREVAAVRLTTLELADPWLARRDQVLGARFFLLDVVPGALILLAPTPLAAAVAAAGLLADRFAFYALAVQHTTEHELTSVEESLEAPHASGSRFGG